MRRFFTVWGVCCSCGVTTFISHKGGSNGLCFICSKIANITKPSPNWYRKYYYCMKCAAFIKHEDAIVKPGQPVLCPKGHKLRTRPRCTHTTRAQFSRDRLQLLKKLQRERERRREIALQAVETRKNHRLKEWVHQHLPELLAGEHIAAPEPEELKR